jgi:Domain of unknown function (DUF4169)
MLALRPWSSCGRLGRVRPRVFYLHGRLLSAPALPLAPSPRIAHIIARGKNAGQGIPHGISGRFDELCASLPMADIINLNKHRKAKARDAAESQSAANRAKYGRTRAEKDNDRRAEERAERPHEGRSLKDEPDA